MTAPELVAGKYELLHPLGSGGMGRVFAARRAQVGDVVALKRLLPSRDTAQNRARLLREAQAAARIRHPAVVQIFDVGSFEDGAPFLVMELVDGPTLEDALRHRGPLSIPRACEIFGELCAAVEAGHRRGVLHRDLTARNVLLGRTDDGREAVKVVDFGIAHLTERPDRLTTGGGWAGTLGYVAPEIIGGAPPSPASDVFALGVLLYQLVTGRLPFESRTPAGFLTALSRGARSTSVPSPVADALASLLAPDPARRPRRPLDAAALLRPPRPADPLTPEPGALLRGTRQLRARVTALPPDLRALLELASVAGQEVSAGLLGRASHQSAETLEQLLAEAQGHGLLARAGPGLFRFGSASLRGLIYEGIPNRRRQRLHRLVLGALDETAGAAARSFHCAAVERWADAVRWGLAAAEDALASHDHEAAESVLHRAGDALAALRSEGGALDPQAELRLQALNAILDSRLGAYQRASLALRQVADGARRHRLRALEADALAELAQAELGLGRTQDALATTQRAIDLSPDPARERSLRVLRGALLTRLGRPAEAAELLQPLVDVPGARRELAFALMKLGDLDAAAAHASASLRQARASGDRWAEYVAVGVVGAIRLEAGDPTGALPALQEALRLSRSLLLRRREAIDLANLGEALLELGEARPALAHFEEALAAFTEIGDEACQGDCTANIGRALAALGRGEEAEAVLTRAVALCERAGRREYEGIARVALAELRLASGDARAAVELLDRAAALLEAHAPALRRRVDRARAKVSPAGALRSASAAPATVPE